MRPDRIMLKNNFVMPRDAEERKSGVGKISRLTVGISKKKSSYYLKNTISIVFTMCYFIYVITPPMFCVVSKKGQA